MAKLSDEPTPATPTIDDLQKENANLRKQVQVLGDLVQAKNAQVLQLEFQARMAAQQ